MTTQDLRAMVLNTHDAARFLGLTEAALRVKKNRGTGPKSFSYNGRDVRYLVSELEAWVREQAGVNDNDDPDKPRGPGRRRKKV